MKYKKRGSLLRQESKIKKFRFIKDNRHEYRAAKLCTVLEISRCSYYECEKGPNSKITIENKKLLSKIQSIHNKSGKAFGSIKVTLIISKEATKSINHKKIEGIMSEDGIRSRISKKFKAITNFNHKLPVAENILNRDFSVNKLNEKIVNNIIYLWTYEGWLYITEIMDLSGQIIVDYPWVKE